MIAVESGSSSRVRDRAGWRPRAAQRVELRSPVVLGGAPRRREPALLLEPMEGGIERSVAHLQDVARHLLEPLADAVPVHGLRRKNLQEQQVEGALYRGPRVASCRS